MNNIREVITDILRDIDDEILEYDGDDLIESGLVDSFMIVSFLALVEERLHISIKPENIVEKNFKTIESIFELIENSDT